MGYIKCMVCGKRFLPTSKNEKLCSKKCKEIRRRNKMREYEKARRVKNKIVNEAIALIEDDEQKRKEERGKKITERQREHGRQALAKWREGKTDFHWTEEMKQKARETREKTKNRRALIKTALNQVLSEVDERSGESNVVQMARSMIERVKKTGDPSAATFIRDSVGESPKQAEKGGNTIINFAPPSQLAGKMVDAEYSELSEREMYERLKAKFENPALEYQATDAEFEEEDGEDD